MSKVIVAMSGGVDSSVAAALLKEQGHEVESIFMKNWSPETSQSLTDCPWEQDQADAAAVCEVLGIPFRSINFEREYKERVVDYFLGEYAAGRTPNPDVMCNKEIKFRVFLDEAMKTGADYIATGHYARKIEIDGRFYVGRGFDQAKDQSYFLWTLNQEQLRRTMFPVGELPKARVRELAASFGLPTASKKDSQGICFIGHLDLKKFLQEHITAKPGITMLVPEGGDSFEERIAAAVEIGRHLGAMFYTIGERAGELMDNKKYKQIRNREVLPVYVIHKDAGRNLIYLTDEPHDPDLLTRSCRLENPWIAPEFDETELTCQVRYQQKIRVEVSSISHIQDQVLVHTKQPMQAVAEGQSLVFYHQDMVVGGGIIANNDHLR